MTTQICPLCGRSYSEYPALSRVLKGVDICPDCGIREALCPQTSKGFIDLWSTARRLPENAFNKIRAHFNEPEEGKVYALTGASDSPAISNGNTWAESEVKDFDKALAEWLKRAQAIINDNYKKMNWTLPMDQLEIDPKGVKFIRIVRVGNQRSVHCFIDKKTGDVLKAASWKAPAPHPRGNIYEIGKEGVDAYGAHYIR